MWQAQWTQRMVPLSQKALKQYDGAVTEEDTTSNKAIAVVQE
jgi:hypothetical protein